MRVSLAWVPLAVGATACTFLFPLDAYGPGASEAGSDAGADVACDQDDSVDPTIVNDAIQISAGGRFTCAVREAGTVICWGPPSYANDDGVLGVDPAEALAPVTIQALSNVRQIAAGAHHICALDGSGAVFCWGADSIGNGNVASDAGVSVPQRVLKNGSPLADVRAIGSGDDFSCALTNGGAVECWGNGAGGRFGGGQVETQAVDVGPTNATQLWVGGGGICVLRNDNLLWCWGSAAGLGQGTESPAVVAISSKGVPRQVAMNVATSCVVAGDERIYCAGMTQFDSLGAALSDAGTFVDTLTLVPELAGSTWVDVATGFDVTCGIDPTSGVSCIGENFVGQLGTGDLSPSFTAARAVVGETTGTLTGVAQLTVGADTNFPRQHACAIVKPAACAPAGKILCWGESFGAASAPGTTPQAVKVPL